jgi:hypothetical protein
MTYFNKKKGAYVWLLIIILFAVFLRVYHFSDWLHFELDQSRDAKVIDLAIKEGPSNLPLLGPKAAGTFLRLGPIFYYFKYLSALIFGNTPSGIAVIVMIFGILAIPAFYLFAKRYFNEFLTLLLTLSFATSLFMVVYSRFSWNPNPLPLFIILAFYALLKSCDSREINKGRWLIILSISLAIVTQLHFLALAAIPTASLIFLLYRRPKIKYTYWIASIFVFIFLYSPAIINDFETGGDNVSQILKVAQGKSANSEHDIIEKSIKSYNENSLGYATILFGIEKRDLPRVIITKNSFPSFICDDNCRNELGLGVFSLIFFTIGSILLVAKALKEKDPTRKDFLILTSIWLFTVLALYIPISFDISPRFFLLVAPIPFIFLGLMLESVAKLIKNDAISKIAVISLVIIICSVNLVKIKQRFWQLENAYKETFKIETDKILKEKTRVTLEQQYKIIAYILEKYKSNHYPVYLNSDPEYRRSFLFHLDNNNIPRDDFRNTSASGKIYRNGNYFLIYPTLSDYQKDLEKYAPYFDLNIKKEFGTLTVFELKPKEESINEIEQDFSEYKKNPSGSSVPARYKWDQIFSDDESE